MKKTLLATLLLASLPLAVQAEDNDVNTRPDVYYMTIEEVADSLKPLPPAMDSIAFLNDKAQYDKGKQLRNTPRGELAYNDAHLSGDGVPQAFSEAFGTPITEKDTPDLQTAAQFPRRCGRALHPCRQTALYAHPSLRFLQRTHLPP